MTDKEIIQEYREAKNKVTQIKILADENLCRLADIVAVLKKAGQDLPNSWLNEKEKKEKAARLAAAAGVKAPVPEPPKKVEPAEIRTEPPKPQPAPKAEPDPEEEEPEINWIPAMLTGSPNLYRAAVEAIAKRLKESDDRPYEDRADDTLERAFNFREQVRGILALIYELEAAE
jgi:hypothetical protein